MKEKCCLILTVFHPSYSLCKPVLKKKLSCWLSLLGSYAKDLPRGICELYAGVLQSEKELAVLSRAHSVKKCLEIKFNLSTVAFYKIPVTTSKQTID